MSEAASMLGVKRTMLYKLCAERKLKRCYIGAKPLISAEEIARYLSSVTAGQTSDDQ
jgi:excisionase family DNA binding protein